MCGSKRRLSRKELRLRVFENRELRRISVSKRDDVMGAGGRWYNEEFHYL
jgi:hypothetical protein